jgi:hypothetical protein
MRDIAKWGESTRFGVRRRARICGKWVLRRAVNRRARTADRREIAAQLAEVETRRR